MSSANPQTLARATGVLFLFTFVTSIAALYLFQPVLDDPAGYVASAGADSRIYLGALLELVLIVANVGTAIALFPILRRQSRPSPSAISRLVSWNARTSEGRDYRRIELAAGAGLHLGYGDCKRHGGPVGAVAGHGV